MPLPDELRGLLSGKMHPVVDPAAAGLLLLLANKPGFAELLRCSVDQLLRRESAQAPVELWFAAALLSPAHERHGHELGLSRIPFQTALHYLDGPPEVAEPAVALFVYEALSLRHAAKILVDGGSKSKVKMLTHRLIDSLFIFRDANGKLMAYHPFTPDTHFVKVDDVTWEWRAEKDYADDDEGFAEQFRLSLRASERASRFQCYITRSNFLLMLAPGTSAPPPPPGVAVEDEFAAAARKAFGSYSDATRQIFVDSVLHAAIHGPAKNVKRRTSDDRSRFDDEYRLAALTALRTWCESDVTSEPVARCPAAQRLVDNGGAMEVALVAIANYNPISHAVGNGWAGCGVMNAGYRVMTSFRSTFVPTPSMKPWARTCTPRSLRL
jgi:hypothetical protein